MQSAVAVARARTAISCDWKHPSFIHPGDHRTAGSCHQTPQSGDKGFWFFCVFQTDLPSVCEFWKFTNLKCQHAQTLQRAQMGDFWKAHTEDKMMDIPGYVNAKKCLMLPSAPVLSRPKWKATGHTLDVKSDCVICFKLRTCGRISVGS